MGQFFPGPSFCFVKVYTLKSAVVDIYVLWTGLGIREYVYLLISFPPFIRATAVLERVELGSFLMRASWQLYSVKKENGGTW